MGSIERRKAKVRFVVHHCKKVTYELLTGVSTINHYDRKGVHPVMRARNTLQARIMSRRNGLRIVDDTQDSPLNGHGLIATEHLPVRHIFLLPRNNNNQF
jgi:hypothetical protein